MGKSRVLASTGGTTLADIRTNLGLGTISTQASSNVDVTGGSVTANLTSNSTTITSATITSGSITANITSANATITSGSITANITSANATITSGSITANITSSNATITGGNATGLITTTSSSITSTSGLVVLGSILEKANISASGMGANITIPATASTIYFTANSTANSTINFTGLSGVTTGNIASFTVLVTNNTLARYISTIQVDGDGTSNITSKWSGGAPTSGTANIDIYSFNVIKTASTPTYTVIGQLSNFK